MRKLQAVSLVLVTLLAVTGCNGSAKAPATAPADAKPALVIPASFPSDAAKLTFSAEAVSNGYYVEANSLLETLVKEHPNAMASNYLGTARYNLGDYAGAIAAWSTAAELDQRLVASMRNNIGNAYRDSMQPEKAEQAYREALQLDPKQWTSAINLATMLHLQGDTAGAVTVLDQAIGENQKITQLETLRDSYNGQLDAPANG